MPSSNPKYKSLDDILSALKDEDQADQTPTEETEDLPKKFPKAETTEPAEISENPETTEKPAHKPSNKEISEIADPDLIGADELDKEDDNEDEIEDESEDDDESTENPEIAENTEPTEPTEKPKPTWRTSPANLKSPKLETSNEQPETSDDEEGASLPESMRDERPNFDVPAPKPAAQGRWADFPEYPVTENPLASIGEAGGSASLNESSETAEPRAHFESNLSDIVENDLGADPTEPDGFPIRRIDHSANNRFGSVRGDRQARFGNTYSGETGVDDDSPGAPKSRSFDYNLTNSGSKNRRWQYLIIALVALITISTIVFLLKNQYIPFIGSPSQVVISSPSPTPSPTPSPSPTPIPDIDRSVFRLRVLNGTTTSGLASSVADKLKALGFKIDKVGNNTSQDIAQTTIRVKPNNASLSAQLVRDLTGQFEATVGADLKSTDSYDGEVVIGAK